MPSAFLALLCKTSAKLSSGSKITSAPAAAHEQPINNAVLPWEPGMLRPVTDLSLLANAGMRSLAWMHQVDADKGEWAVKRELAYLPRETSSYRETLQVPSIPPKPYLPNGLYRSAEASLPTEQPIAKYTQMQPAGQHEYTLNAASGHGKPRRHKRTVHFVDTSNFSVRVEIEEPGSHALTVSSIVSEAQTTPRLEGKSPVGVARYDDLIAELSALGLALRGCLPENKFAPDDEADVSMGSILSEDLERLAHGEVDGFLCYELTA